MNTNFWGPPAWRVLHGLSLTKNCDAAKQLVELLPEVLPCCFCRASFLEFKRALPDAGDACGKGALPEWYYDVHELVNAKLQTQRFDAAGVSGAAAEMLREQMRLPKHVFLLRLRTVVPYYSAADLAAFLGITVLEPLHADDGETVEERLKKIRTFARVLFAAASTVPGAPSLPGLATWLDKARTQQQAAWAVAAAVLSATKQAVTKTSVTTTARQWARTKAGNCKNGVCGN